MNAHTNPGRDRQILLVFCYAIALVTAFAYRLNWAPDILINPNSYIAEMDSARVFRQIGLIAHHYPSFPLFDSFANFPWGMRAQLPPVWAFTLATFGMIAHYISGVSVEAGASLFPTILALLLVIPTYYAASILFGKATGHISAIISLFIPATIYISYPTMVDHHIADLFIYALIIALLIGANYHYSHQRNRRADSMASLTGIAIVFLLLMSISSILVVAILAVSLLISFTILESTRRNYAARLGFIAFGSSATAMTLLFILTPWFKHNLSFSVLSYFQPLVLIGLTGVIGTLYAVDRFMVKQDRLRIGLYLALYVIFILVIFLVPGLRETIYHGFYRSIGLSPLGSITNELKPIFQDGSGRFVAKFSYLGYLLPLGFAVAISNIALQRKQRLNFGQVIIVTWFLFATAYTIRSGYYKFLLMPAAVIMLGLTIVQLSEWIAALVCRIILFNKVQITNNFWGYLALTMLSCTVLLTAAPQQRHNTNPHVIQMIKWIKANTPAVSNFNDLHGRPEYGILADWNIGELVELMAERPTVATANQETGIKGIITHFKFFQSNSEGQAVALMRKTSLRYALLGYAYGPWVGDIDRIGDSSANPNRIAYMANPNKMTKSSYLRQTYPRLRYLLGGGNDKYGVEPMQHFRLINMTGTNKYNAYLLFEHVKGFHLSITEPPGTEVIVSTEITCTQRNRILWRIKRRIGDKGNIDIYLPYATKGANYPVTAKPYCIQIGNNVRMLDVLENDVVRGNGVELSSSIKR